MPHSHEGFSVEISPLACAAQQAAFAPKTLPQTRNSHVKEITGPPTSAWVECVFGDEGVCISFRIHVFYLRCGTFRCFVHASPGPWTDADQGLGDEAKKKDFIIPAGAESVFQLWTVHLLL